MKIFSCLFAAIGFASSFGINLSEGAELAGSDFSDAAVFNEPGGALDILGTDDLDPTDGITVSDWSAAGGGGFVNVLDLNAQVGMPNDTVAKINGDAEPQPAVGTEPADVLASVSFSIDIPAGTIVDLSSVDWVSRQATGTTTNVRWLAFKTSLDPTLIYSEVGSHRDDVDTVSVDLSGAAYQGLTNMSVTLTWYAGGNGSGDQDFDTPVVSGTVRDGDDLDMDGLTDVWEEQIIDADETDDIVTIEDVLPEDDFDSDGADNGDEFENRTDPVDEDSDDDGLLDGVETNDGSFDSLESDTGTDPLDSDTDGDGLSDGVETNDGSFDSAATDTGSNPLVVDSDEDSYGDGEEVNVFGTDPNDPESRPRIAPAIVGADFSDSEVFDSPGGNYDNSLSSTDDLDPDDNITVTDWTFAGGASFTGLDANAQVGMPSDLVTKIDGNAETQPAVGSEPSAALASVSFSIVIPAGTVLDLSAVEWVSRQATGTTSNVRWLAFNTSLDTTLLYSEVGSHRNDVDTVSVNLSGPAYQGLTDTTVTFNWYAGGNGSGDQDFDTPIVRGTVSAGGGPPEGITEIIYDDTTEPGNVLVTLTFTSKLGERYSVFTSTDFADPVLDREDIDDSIEGGDGSTTVVVDFNASGLSTTDPRRFFVVRENDE
ncbi:MAG: hypothetical protein ACR2RV_05395 [Verrucomicrobiales bacterium]